MAERGERFEGEASRPCEGAVERCAKRARVRGGWCVEPPGANASGSLWLRSWCCRGAFDKSPFEWRSGEELADWFAEVAEVDGAIGRGVERQVAVDAELFVDRRGVVFRRVRVG